MLHRRLEKRAPEAAPAPLGEDVEFLEVRVERARVEGGTEAKLGEPVRALPCEENGHVAAFHQRCCSLGDRVRVRLRLAVLGVEGVQELPEDGGVDGGRDSDSRLLYRHALRRVRLPTRGIVLSASAPADIRGGARGGERLRPAPVVVDADDPAVAEREDVEDLPFERFACHLR
jgi:hypothetical protein